MALIRWCIAVVLLGGGMIPANSVAAPPEAGRSFARSADSKLHPALTRVFAKRVTSERVKAWVLFTDKGLDSAAAREFALRDVEARYNPRALQRRRHRRTLPDLVDEHDLPVATRYHDAVAASGAQVVRASKWVNGVSVLATADQLARIARFPFVKIIQPVRRGRKIAPVNAEAAADAPGRVAASQTLDYGWSFDQNEQINLVALHDAGYTGSGVVIGILDTGFRRAHVAFNQPGHVLNVVAEWDFVDNDADTSNQPGDPLTQHSHGTRILGTLGAYKPGELVGTAFGASYILCKTEDTTREVRAEEDNFVAGLEFIEAHGGDVATSSLGYDDWYTQSDFDGLTAVTTIAVNIATANGVHCCNSTGNGGHDLDPATSHLTAPADALQVISCGAVDSSGTIASYSSDGPTADGRVKPELLARGILTQTVDYLNDTEYDTAGGTSLAAPLIAGAVACLAGAHPEWTVDTMRSQLSTTASYFVEHGTHDPLYVLGYGIPDAYAAFQFSDCNLNGVPDASDVDPADPDGDGEVSLNCNSNLIPDECEPDDDLDGIPDDCDGLGDYDHDADVDLVDYVPFEFCLSVSWPVDPPQFQECLDVFDVDSSDTIDLRDFAAFLQAFTD